MPGSSPVWPRVPALPRPTPECFQRKTRARFFIPEQKRVSFLKGAHGSRCSWVEKTRTAGGCKRNGRRERKGQEQKGRAEESSYCKKDKRDAEQMGPHSKMAWQGLSASPKQTQAARKKTEFGGRPKKGRTTGKREVSWGTRWTKTVDKDAKEGKLEAGTRAKKLERST